MFVALHSRNGTYLPNNVPHNWQVGVLFMALACALQVHFCGMDICSKLIEYMEFM